LFWCNSISGQNIGDNPQIGIYFEHETGSEIFKVAENDIIVNNPSELIVMIPALESGQYTILQDIFPK
jgi:hypothetical protein